MTTTPDIREKVARAIYSDRSIVRDGTLVGFDDLDPQVREVALERADSALLAMGYKEMKEALEKALPLVEQAEFLDSKSYSYGPGHSPPLPGEWGISVEYIDSKAGSCVSQYYSAVEKFHADNRAEDDGSGQFLTVANSIRAALEKCNG